MGVDCSYIFPTKKYYPTILQSLLPTRDSTLLKERRGRDVAIKGITNERIASGTDLGLQRDLAHNFVSKGGRNAAGGVGKEILPAQDGKVLFKGDISAYLPMHDIVHAKLWLWWGRVVEIFEIVSFMHGFQTKEHLVFI